MFLGQAGIRFAHHTSFATLRCLLYKPAHKQLVSRGVNTHVIAHDTSVVPREVTWPKKVRNWLHVGPNQAKQVLKQELAASLESPPS